MSSSRSKCMEKGCNAPPEHECRWAGARARAWFCGKHYEPWKKSTDKGEDGKGGWLELVSERKVLNGVVGKKYNDEPKKTASEVQRKQAEMTQEASVALMTWLSKLTQSLGVSKHVYVVGGAVRNFLIDQPIKDIDMVIDAIALGRNRDAQWLAEHVDRAIPTQTEIATSTLLVSTVFIKGPWVLDGHQMEGEAIDIATSRSEEYEQDDEGNYLGHKPIRVSPVPIEEDMRRREFTFNTLLWRLHDLASGPDKAEIIDLTGCGVKDLESREMRCPSDPDQTFREDPTRIIRTIKFAFKYGFTLPTDVKAAARRQVGGLKRIPSQTWAALRDIALANPQYKKALLVMADLGVADVVREMIEENDAFASAIARYTTNRGIAFMFDLMDIGVPVDAQIAFLDGAEQARFREATTPMDREDALAYLAALKNPGNAIGDKRFMPALAAKYNIPKSDYRKFFPAVALRARGMLLESPELMSNPTKLKQRIDSETGRGVALGKTAEHIPGGIAKGMQPSDFNSEELEVGTRVEHEHLVGDGYSKAEMEAKAQEIAMDHLAEIPDYYTRLTQMESEAGGKHAAWGPTIVDATSVQVKTAKTYTRLVMFDFDGTLFRSWEATPEWWAGSALDDGPYSFFVRPESLDTPCVPDKPGSAYWIQMPLAEAKKAIADRSAVTVLITGRVGVHKRRVKELLKQKGLDFDHYYFNPGMAADRFKVVVLKNLLVGYNTVDKVEVWENENQKTYDSAMRATAEAVGREIAVEVHHVHVPAKELECGPADFNLPSLNNPQMELRMATSKAAAQTGDGTGVGLFIPLPEHVASQFPSLAPHDDSPSHITFLYVGKVAPDQEEAFMVALQEGMRKLEGPVRATLDGVDIFQQQDKRVAVSRVRFCQDIIQAHDRIKAHLDEAGFPVAHSFPFLTPHVTLAYMGPHDNWKGMAPEGDWVFDRMQVWGMSEVREVSLGEELVTLPEEPELGARKFASLNARRASEALLRSQWFQGNDDR